MNISKCKYILGWAVGVLTAVLAASCGNHAPNPNLPAPGTMQLVGVIKVERSVKQDRGGNLLAGGDFQNWWVGAPVPQGLFPPDASGSKVEHGEGGVHQIWQKPDSLGTLNSRLRAEVQSLKPGTYQLEALASGSKGNTVSMGLWIHADDAKPQLLDDDFITVLPADGQVKRYARRFTLDNPVSLIVATKALPGSEKTTEVTWYQWRLTRVGDEKG